MMSLLGTPARESEDRTINVETTTTTKKVDHREIEMDFRRDTFWKSCCNCVLDRRATIFFTQVAFGTVVIAFSMARITMIRPRDCVGDDPSIYLAMITLVLGWFAPQPTMK